MSSWRIKTDLILATLIELVHKLPGLVAAMVLARAFAKEEMGAFFFAATLASVFALVTMFGTGRHLVRAVAQQPEAALHHLGETLSLRLPLTAAALIAMNGAMYLVRPDIWALVLLTSVYVLVGDLYYSFGALFVGRRRLGLRLLTGAVGPVVLVASVLIAVEHGASLNTVLLCYVGAQLLMLAVAVAVVRLRFGPVPLRWNRGATGALVAACWPFLALQILDVIQFKADTVMIFALASEAAVASYETAYKLLEVSRLVVRSAAMVFFPLCAMMAASGDWAGFGRVFRGVALAVGALGAALALAVIAGADLIMPAVWGESYADGAPILRVLYLTAPALFIGFVATQLAAALHLERTVMAITLVAALANVSLNAVLIPRWGALGAAWATLATQVLLTIGVVGAILGALRARTAVREPGTVGPARRGRPDWARP